LTEKPTDPTISNSKVIAITSGKGGVGKTNVSVNLAIALARKGKRVCVFDADASLANVNILLNIRPQFTLEQLLNGERKLEDILVEGPEGIRIVPAASGIAEFAQLDDSQQAIMLKALAELERQFDFLLIDTAAGISSNVTQFIQAAQHCILVVTPEPTSLTDAFALMKVLHKNKSATQLHVLTNMVDDYANSVDIYKRLSSAAMRYLHMQTHYLGYIPRDDLLRIAVQKQSPVCVAFPSSPASYRFLSLADSIESIYVGQKSTYSFSLFWRKLLRTKPAKAPRTINAPISHSKNAAPSVNQPLRSKLSKAIVVKLQKGFVHLIQSRTLSANSMKSLMASLVRQIGVYYPEITLDELSSTDKKVTKVQHDKP
jgi:flagellar biosynthesis protein FlhG